MRHREPWKLTYDDGGPDCPALRDKDGHIVADVYGAENGRRIVACVNACHGVETEELECDIPTFIRMMQQRERMQEFIRELLHPEGYGYAVTEEVRDAARRVLDLGKLGAGGTAT